MASSGTGTAEKLSSDWPAVHTQKQKLREVLGAARPSWGPKDLAAAENKLKEVGASSLFQLKSLLDAPPETGLNQRLRDVGLKAFGPETLAALREELAKPALAPYLRKPRPATDTGDGVDADKPLTVVPSGSPTSAAEANDATEATPEDPPRLEAAPVRTEERKDGGKAKGAAGGPAGKGSPAPAPEAIQAAPVRTKEREEGSKAQEAAGVTTGEGRKAPAPEAHPTYVEGVMGEWSVVHTRVIVRDTPATSGKVAGLAPRGQIMKGIVEDVGGTKWLRVRAGDVEGDFAGRGGLAQWEVLLANSPVRERKDPSSPVLGIKSKGTLTFGRQDGEWLALHQEKGFMRISAGEETFLQAASERSLWMLIDGASLGLGPLLRPTSTTSGDGAGAPAAPSAEKSDGKAEEDALLTTSGIDVRRVPGRGLGLFATRRFAAGEVVLEESPFWTRPQPEEVKKYKALFKPEWAEAFTSIKEPLAYPGEDAEAKIYASPAMVRNALGYGKATPAIRRKILRLHQPELDCGHPIVAVAGRVAALCIEHLKDCRDVDQVELQRAILAVEMNIFAGGRCFSTFSRLNHSCFPNAVYIAMKQKWCFKALRDINEGEEILHSYLGKELLLPTEIRKRLLWRSKCFDCACERCTATADAMRALPCRWCSLEEVSLTVAHSPGIWLRDEPSKYGAKKVFMNKGTSLKVAGSIDATDWAKEDWVKVHHPDKGQGWVLVHGRSLDPPLGVLVVDSQQKGSLLTEGPDEKQATSYWTVVVDFLASTDQLLDDEDRDDHVELLSDTVADRLWLPSYAYGVGENAPPCVTFHEGSWRCERCQRTPDQQEMLLTTERLAGRLTECTFFSPAMTPALGTFSGKTGGLKMVKQGFIHKAKDLAITVTGVLGRRHWCYHWAQILFVDLLITRIQYSNGRKVDVGAYYLLEMLYELWEWLSSLGMAQDPGCFLHGRVAEALRLLVYVVAHMDELSRWRFENLKERLEASTTQIEILPLRPLIIEGTISFQ